MRKTQPLSAWEQDILDRFVGWLNECNAEQEHEKKGR